MPLIGSVYRMISTLLPVVEPSALDNSHHCFLEKRCGQLCFWIVMTQDEDDEMH